MFGSRVLPYRQSASAPACKPCYAPAAPRSRRLIVVRAEAKPLEKMRRAPSAYNLFYKAKYPEIRKALTKGNQAPTLAECAAELYKRWASLPANQKAPYEDEAAKLKVQLDELRAQGLVHPPKKRGEKKTGPTRAPNAYALFLKQEFPGFKAKNPTASATDIAKLVAQKWKTLSEAQKEAIKAQAAKAAEELKKAQAAAAPAPPKAAAKATPAKPAAVKPAAAAPKAATPSARGATPTSPAKHASPAASTSRTTPPRAGSAVRKTPAK